MIELRQNQIEPIRKAIDFFKKGHPNPSLIILPTAWGKSILTAFVAKNCNDKILVLQPSKELLEQNYNKYIELCGDLGFQAGIYSASFKRKDIKPITYATIGSIKSLGADFKHYGFTKMIIDEAHLYPRESDSMLGRFLIDSGITHVLGITATPIKLQQNRDLTKNTYSKLVMLTSRSKKGNFYKEIIHVGQIGEMVKLGFWSPLLYKVKDFDSSQLVFNSCKSEYTEDSVQAAYEANGGSETILSALDFIPERKHILVFVPSVVEAQYLATHYPDSAAVYGDMPKGERAEIISRFREGRIRVLFNVRILSTGFDYTGIDCILLAMSTASVALYYQIIGRGTRIDGDKRDCLIIDLGGNVDRFGKVEDITFEQGKIWRMFGTCGRLLSGIPIHDIGKYTIDDVRMIEKKEPCQITIMPFGKYKNKKIKDIPKQYKQWMLNTFQWDSRNANLRNSILRTI